MKDFSSLISTICHEAKMALVDYISKNGDIKLDITLTINGESEYITRVFKNTIVRKSTKLALHTIMGETYNGRKIQLYDGNIIELCSLIREKELLVAAVMAAINKKGNSDGSYYLTNGATVCTIDVSHCGIEIGEAKFCSLNEWEEWYGEGLCPHM